MTIITLQIIAVLAQIYIANTSSTKRIMIATFAFNLFSLLCYLFNHDMVTVYMYMIIVVRSAIYIYRDKLKKYTIIPIFFILLQLGIGFSNIEAWHQVISILTPCYVVYYMWFYDTTQKLRWGNVVNNAAWGIYNTITGLYIIALSRLVSVIVNLVAIHTHSDKKEQK